MGEEKWVSQVVIHVGTPNSEDRHRGIVHRPSTFLKSHFRHLKLPMRYMNAPPCSYQQEIDALYMPLHNSKN
jgi:hypothetical protein